MKLSVIPFVFFVFLSISVKSQTEEPKPKKFSFGVNFSPDYSYRRLVLENDPWNFVDSRNKVDGPQFGFTTGILTDYKFSTRFSIETGIQFSDKGETFKMPIQEFGYPDPLTSEQPKKLFVKYHYYYLGVPLKLNYYFYQKRIRMNVSAGVSTDFFLDAKSKTVMKFSDRTETYENDESGVDFNNVNLIGLVGFGAETDLFQRIRIRVEPVFRYSLTPMVDDLMKEYLYSAGLNLVLFYQ